MSTKYSVHDRRFATYYDRARFHIREAHAALVKSMRVGRKIQWTRRARNGLKTTCSGVVVASGYSFDRIVVRNTDTGKQYRISVSQIVGLLEQT